MKNIIRKSRSRTRAKQLRAPTPGTARWRLREEHLALVADAIRFATRAWAAWVFRNMQRQLLDGVRHSLSARQAAWARDVVRNGRDRALREEIEALW